MARSFEGNRFWAAVRERLYRLRRKLATVAIILLACLLMGHVLLGPNGMLAYQQKREQYRQLEQEVESLRRENSQLAERIHDLRSDPRAIEKEAREQLRYARPGELVFVLPEPRVKAPSGPESTPHP